MRKRGASLFFVYNKLIIMSTPHPAVQQLTNSSPLTPAISSRWSFREKVLDSSPIESYDRHTNKAKLKHPQ